MSLTVTLDLEDSSGVNGAAGRWVSATDRFLEELDAGNIRATVFVVGEAARAAPDLVRRVSDAGHEIGLHGLRHVPLAMSGGLLQTELEEGRALLQDLTGQPIEGFRAPIFSLTPTTSWAVDVLTAVGFSYDSSILPAANPLHGWAGLPEVPFRWSTGLTEFPCPVLGIGPARIPFLGGIYLRYVPLLLSRPTLARLSEDTSAAPWSYVHPYDMDPGAPVRRFPHANWPTSLLLHTRRRATLPRLRRLITASGGSGEPLGTIAARLAGAPLQQIDASA